MTDEKKDDKSKKIRINIEIPRDLEATYANMVLINQTASEIILDFAQALPNNTRAKVHARVVMTPTNAKLLYRALGQNLKKFEAKHGEIPTPDGRSNIVIDPNKGFSQ